MSLDSMRFLLLVILVLPLAAGAAVAALGPRNRSGVRWVALFNAAEAERQVVQLREMASGEQSEVSWAQLPERLA